MYHWQKKEGKERVVLNVNSGEEGETDGMYLIYMRT